MGCYLFLVVIPALRLCRGINGRLTIELLSRPSISIPIIQYRILLIPSQSKRKI